MLSQNLVRIITISLRSGIRNCHESVVREDSSSVHHALKQISILRHHLQCSLEDALTVIRDCPDVGFRMSAWSLNCNLTYIIKDLHFKASDVISNPHFLRNEKSVIESRISILKDFGFSGIGAKAVHEFPNLMTKSPQDLMSGGSELVVDPVNHVLNLLEKDIADEMRKELSPNVYLHWPLAVIHKGMIVILLVNRLQCTEKKALRILKKEPDVCTRSVSSLNEVLSILLKNVAFKKDSLFLDSKILCATPKDIHNCFKKPFYGDVSEAEDLGENPSHLLISFEEFKELEKTKELQIIYKDHGITAEQLKSPLAYTILPDEAARCLEKMEEKKELKMLKVLPNYLDIALKADRVQHNLEYMKSKGYVCWSAKTLLLHSGKLPNHLLHNSDSCVGIEAAFILAAILKETVADVAQRLKLHPHSKRVSYYNAKLLVDGLLEKGVSKHQIWNTLPVVFYDHNLVLKTFSELETYPELSPFEEWRSHPGLMSLVVYYIEKENFFSFSNVY